MGNSARLIRRRNRLWSENPHCHWCGTVTILSRPEMKKSKFPDNMATIDHLRPRLHPDRHEPTTYNQEIRTVLACNRCNNLRNKEFEQSLPKEFLQQRAQNGHKSLTN